MGFFNTLFIKHPQATPTHAQIAGSGPSFTFLSPILLCALVSGCVQRAVYSESWDKQVKMETNSCPVIDGEYQNTGEQFYKKNVHEEVGIPRSLAHLLNGGFDNSWHDAEDRLGHTAYDPSTEMFQSIRLRHIEDRLHVEALSANGSTKQFDLPLDKQCRDSTLLVEISWEGSTAGLFPLVSAVNHERLALGRTEDGSLLARTHTKGGIFITAWPILGYIGSNWIRFPPVSPPSPQQPELAP